MTALVLLLNLAVGSTLVGAAAAGDPTSAASQDEPSQSARTIARATALAAEARTALEGGDHGAARARAAEAIELLLASPEGVSDSLDVLLGELGTLAHSSGDLAAAERARRRVLEVGLRTLPGDHPKVQLDRMLLATTIKLLGDLDGARELEEQVLEVYTRTLPDDHRNLQVSRLNLANTLKGLGDLHGALALEELVLEIRQRTLPDDHPDLQVARNNLGITREKLGDLHGARALQEKAFEVCSRTLPDEHPFLQSIRGNLAITRHRLGDLDGARALQEKLLEVWSRTLPGDHPNLVSARLNLAIMLKELGRVREARTLEEQVLQARSRALPDDHPAVQEARLNLAVTLHQLGDLAGAQALNEQALEVFSRTLPDDHAALQRLRLNQALVLADQGEVSAARELEEQVLEVYTRTLPDDHPDLQIVRQNLASTLFALGDVAGARELAEKVVEVRTRTLAPDHPDLLDARHNLAGLLRKEGDVEGARALLEDVLAIRTRALPDDHPDLSSTRRNLADTLVLLDDRESLRGVASDFVRGLRRAIEDAIVTGSSREAEERAASEAENLACALHYAGGAAENAADAVLEREVFGLVEIARDAGLAAAVLRNLARADPTARELLERARGATTELARLGALGAERDVLLAATRARDDAQRALSAHVRTGHEEAGRMSVPDPIELGRALGERAALVSFWRYPRVVSADPGTAVESLLAHVVRSDGSLRRVELGPVEWIERAAEEWRSTLGGVDGGRGLAAPEPDAGARSEHEASTALCRLVFDPLRPALGDADELVVVPDDVVLAFPLDALSDGEGVLGERFAFQIRQSARELLTDPIPIGGDGIFAAVGGVDYGRRTEGAAPPSLLRGSAAESGFTALPATAVEVDAIGALWRSSTEREPRIVTGSDASVDGVAALAPDARILHVATHGWFDTGSVRSTSDRAPAAARSSPLNPSQVERVKGIAPLLLCGLALAGANLPPDELGRVPGVATAEEISSWDLSNCELAVLSACDTNVGVRRAGQGIASLQKALHMAGAQSAITSLWKVPDEATKDLMLDFYRRLWMERKPKHQALWEAKMRLRDARGEDGALLYTTRDWAAWVLSGVPD